MRTLVNDLFITALQGKYAACGGGRASSLDGRSEYQRWGTLQALETCPRYITMFLRGSIISITVPGKNYQSVSCVSTGKFGLWSGYPATRSHCC